MIKYELTEYNEENGYCVLNKELEDNPFVFFHITPKSNFKSICDHGFDPMYRKKGVLTSTSYAHKTSSCLVHRGPGAKNEDFIIFVVKYDKDFNWEGVTRNQSDIHVFDNYVQPKIIGYAVVPKDFEYT